MAKYLLEVGNMRFDKLKLACGAAIALLIAGTVAANDRPSDIVNTAAGEVIVTHFANHHALGATPSGDRIIQSIKQVRKRVQSTPENHRVQFYWTILMVLNFDASFLSEVHEMIIEDCGDSFVQYAKEFLAKSGKGELEDISSEKDFSRYQTQLNALGRMRIHYFILKKQVGKE